MTFQQRSRWRLLAAGLILCTVGLIMLFRLRLTPMVEQLVITLVDNQASDAINAAIARQIAAGDIDYERMVLIEKDAGGTVTAIRTNIAEINRLKTSILQRVDEILEQLSVEDLQIPLGSALLPELFSGQGPRMSVRVLAVRASDANFESSFAQAGINQTLHRIIIDIHVIVTIMTWSGTRDVEVKTSVIAAETVVVGTVPTTYFGMEESNGP